MLAPVAPFTALCINAFLAAKADLIDEGLLVDSTEEFSRGVSVGSQHGGGGGSYERASDGEAVPPLRCSQAEGPRRLSRAHSSCLKLGPEGRSATELQLKAAQRSMAEQVYRVTYINVYVVTRTCCT